MFLKRRIHLLRYLALSVAGLAIFVYFCLDTSKLPAVLCAFYFVVSGSFGLLLWSFDSAFASVVGKGVKGSKKWIVFSVCTKSLLMILVFYIGVQLVGDGIIIGLLFYMYLLIVLGVSLKRE